MATLRAAYQQFMPENFLGALEPENNLEEFKEIFEVNFSYYYCPNAVLSVFGICSACRFG